MRKNILSTVLCMLVFISNTLQAQQHLKEITLEEIWNGTFSPNRMNSLNPMNGDFYSVLNFHRATRSTSIDQYSYTTLKKVKTIIDSKDLKELDFFNTYSFNKDETKIILGTNFQSIYRHSYKGTFYIYDMRSKKLVLIGKQIQEPVFSPNSKFIAYAKNNNLFVKNIETNNVTQVTFDGKKNSIINGITDWVYEEEFAFVRAFKWNITGEYLAYLKFNESKVPIFSMDIVGEKLYPSKQEFKYPKAGEENAKVSLHIFDMNAKIDKELSLPDYEYIPRIQWSTDTYTLVATTLNRQQNKLKLNAINVTDLESLILLEEKDDAYIDVTDNLTFLEDHSFIWTSEQDGFNHIYHYNKKGKLINQITKGNWEVTDYYGFHKRKKTIYYQSVENGSINRGVYAIRLNGKNKKLLTQRVGQSDASFSKNFNYFINSYSSAETPPVYSLYTEKGKKVKDILYNRVLKEDLATYNFSKKEFSTITINENELNMWVIKPSNFDATKKYPLLLFQYSGPGSQQVANIWNGSNDYWHNMLAQKGIIVACVDGRGTGFKGAAFKKSTYLNLVKHETEDQIAVAKQLAKKPFIDQSKIGIWGWSFGGHMSTNCILKGNDVFSMAIAVAPVTSWRFYDTIYTERFLRTPQENPTGYDENSPINYADKLKGNYLLVHGTGDDNVHVQNTYRMINALIEANKQFDLFIVPDRTHGIYEGKNTRLNLYTKMTNFIEKNLLK